MLGDPFLQESTLAVDRTYLQQVREWTCKRVQ